MGWANYIALALMIAVAGVMLAGIVTMMIGKNSARSNKLMVWRVGLQAVAIVFAALFLASR